MLPRQGFLPRDLCVLEVTEGGDAALSSTVSMMPRVASKVSS
jgi:hypothetical protein